MRWEALFADMEAQLEAARVAELAVDVAELTRAERATVRLGGRLRATRGSAVTFTLRGNETVTGTLVEVADEWVLVSEGIRRALVPIAAVTAVRGMAAGAAPESGGVVRRLGLAHALRAVARDRASVRVSTDGGELAGRIDAVGADHADLAAGVDGRRADGAVWTVPFGAIRVVRSG
ncbi:hypothetical protein [Cellulomonas fimi]|uniref:Fis family transcriptional regulator n=1 Tax=Cellulomonas fimi TaxID=1708 RepID=A0A7Y0QI44_CELFI|nr:hypothetical protein [Cellulomonas fimi]NMR20808.1 hypothetical protein [Cellulomonas fimi]